MVVLNIEDDIYKHSAISRALKKQGFRTEHAKTGEEGLKLLAANHYDLIVCDMQFPINGVYNTNGGLWVLEELKKAENKTPLIFCSSVRLVVPGHTAVHYDANSYSFEQDLIRSLKEATKKSGI